MVDFVLGRAVIDDAQRKRVKYMDNYAAIGYRFLPFSFSILRELKEDAVNLLKRVRKFYMAQDIGTRSVVHTFNRISFAITKGTKLLWHVGIVASSSTFDDGLCVFNTSMKIDLLSNPSEIAAPKLMKKIADIYFTRVTKDAESTFSLSTRQVACDNLKGRITLLAGIRRFLFLACLRVLAEDIYGDHAVSCASSNGMTDCVPGRAVIDDAQRKCIKYMAKCAAIGYGFLPFSFSSLRELEDDAVRLLKQIRKFFMA
nr:hypothetical protein [Tanacetum cinerariifolium]